MSQRFKIVCRGSKLSLTQAGLVKKRLLQLDPRLDVRLVIKETRGDADQSISLQDIEGKDFFTRDIQDYLVSGQADFAVHSLKDVSGEDFFQGTRYAILEREDPRDAAIFGKNILDRIAQGQRLRMGTSSPRRAEMAMSFLTQALPARRGRRPSVEAISIRGNVDTRLQKLASGEYDGVILAFAGLNRLLRSEYEAEVRTILEGTSAMALPLMECPPAPGQGAIVVESNPDNAEAVRLLHDLNNPSLAGAVSLERKVAHRYGSGCHQRFGVVHVNRGKYEFVHASGKDRSDTYFHQAFNAEGLPSKAPSGGEAADPDDPFFAKENVVLLNDSGATESVIGARGIQAPRIWAANTDLWLSVAKEGVWVEGSLEGFGLAFNKQTIESPLLSKRGSDRQLVP